MNTRAASGRALLLLPVLLAGCAIRPVTPALERVDPAHSYVWNPARALPDNDPRTLFVLTFSGGGTRAAALAYGVLEELRRTTVATPRGVHPALLEVDLITGISGGSFTALAYALYGERLFETYDRAFLKRDVEGELLKRLINPLTWPQMLSAGFGRSELAEEYYNEILFHGATYGDLLPLPHPIAIAGSTDVTTGMQIIFSQRQFDVICGDLRSFPLARAAAASSAVPGIMSPVTLDNRAGSCGYRPPPWVAASLDRSATAWPPSRIDFRNRQLELLANSAARPYIHLVDGGIADNLGIYGIIEALQEAQLTTELRNAIGLAQFKRIAIVIVNARSSPSYKWDQVPTGPGTLELLWQAISLPIDRYSSESIAALGDMVTEWRLHDRVEQLERQLDPKGTLRYPIPDMDFSIVDVSFDAVTDPDLRSYLQNLPTTLALSDEAVDRLRAAGAHLLRDSPAFRRLLEGLAKQP